MPYLIRHPLCGYSGNATLQALFCLVPATETAAASFALNQRSRLAVTGWGSGFAFHGFVLGSFPVLKGRPDNVAVFSSVEKNQFIDLFYNHLTNSHLYIMFVTNWRNFVTSCHSVWFGFSFDVMAVKIE